MPFPRSLVHLKREISDAKWTEAKKWSYVRINRKKYRPSRKQLTDPVVALLWHSVVTWLCPGCVPVAALSCVSRGFVVE